MRILITLLFFVFITGCIEQKVNNKNENSNTNTNSNNGGGTSGGTTTGGTTGSTTGTTTGSTTGEVLPAPGRGTSDGSSSHRCFEQGVSDNGSSIDYYPLPVKGAGNRSSAPQWSSASDIADSGASDEILVTDARMHVRVVAKEAPGVDGTKCHQKQLYQNLELKVGIRGQNSASYLETMHFKNVKVGECSNVLAYSRIPTNDPANPPILEIYDVMWDYDCIYRPNDVGGCPRMTEVWGGSGYNACWQIELQIATDGTKDIPR